MKPQQIFNQLYKKYGHQHWWPTTKGRHDSLFEICVGAILTQNTAWTNVEKALACLIKNKLMSPRAVAKAPLAKLQKCIRSSGYYRQKAKKLKIFTDWLIKNYQGNLKRFFKKSLSESRGELLGLWGIGRETADSILLYAGGQPIFVVDAYTKRLCQKYGLDFKDYDECRHFFESRLKPTKKFSRAKLYNEFHALIIRWGKEQ
ncbi:MAG: hypothetical protein AAB568_01510 [Patescibacteria group bacterium]